jgi:hypothetical protein
MSQVSFVQGFWKEFVTNALQQLGLALSALVATSLQLVLVTNVTLECSLLEPIPVRHFSWFFLILEGLSCAGSMCVGFIGSDFKMLFPATASRVPLTTAHARRVLPALVLKTVTAPHVSRAHSPTAAFVRSVLFSFSDDLQASIALVVLLFALFAHC